FDNVSKILKVTKDSTKILNNGDEDIFFVEDPFAEYIDFDKLKITKNGALDKKYIDLINFVAFEGLTPDHQKILLKHSLVCSFFLPIIKSKPLLVFQSELPGSGKTKSLAAIGHILKGSRFTQSLMPKDERDFFVSILNNHYYVMDNVDRMLPDWFEDNLATILTGAGITQRKLYTSNESFYYRHEGLIGITTIQARFNRNDIADRSLVFNLGRLKNFDPRFSERILENRLLILSDILAYVQGALTLLESTQKLEYTELRLSEYGGLLKLFADIYGIKDSSELISALKSSQSDFSGQNDPLADQLEDFVNHKEGFYRAKTRQLYKDFKNFLWIEYKEKILYTSAISFGRALKAKEEIIGKKIIIYTSTLDGYQVWNLKTHGQTDLGF
ncbi:hypothetical protein KC717_06240, partial [Candidatus Dojkabacteria bacterium]|nr:hypothetical protein [Candidatus Dojkabacteria bacterium]